MGIIDASLAKAITGLPTLDLSHFAAVADRLAWEHDAVHYDLTAYPGPGWDADEPYCPTPEEDAERLGYELGLAGEDFPEAFESRDLYNAYRGLIRGMLAGDRDRILRELAERLEFEAWLDSIRTPEATWHEAELDQARACSGHPAYEG